MIINSNYKLELTSIVIYFASIFLKSVNVKCLKSFKGTFHRPAGSSQQFMVSTTEFLQIRALLHFHFLFHYVPGI